MHMLAHWLLNAVIIFAVAHLVPGIRVKDFGTSLTVALVLGILTWLLAKPLTILGTALVTILALPAVLLTLGLLIFVIKWVVGFLVMLLLLRTTASFVEGFMIADTGSAALGAILIALFQTLAGLGHF